VLAVNLNLDVAWAPSTHGLLGETIGFSLVTRTPSGEMAIPLGEAYGLLLRATTHAGFRP